MKAAIVVFMDVDGAKRIMKDRYSIL